MTAQTDTEILIVEDDANDAELELIALRDAGIAGRIAVARDGAEAFEFISGLRTAVANGARVVHLKLVILDLKLPKLSGTEILRVLKSDDVLKPIPVVILTSSAELQDIASTYRIGTNSYVIKPVDSDRFMTTIRDICHYWLTDNHPPYLAGLIRTAADITEP